MAQITRAASYVHCERLLRHKVYNLLKNITNRSYFFDMIGQLDAMCSSWNCDINLIPNANYSSHIKKLYMLFQLFEAMCRHIAIVSDF